MYRHLWATVIMVRLPELPGLMDERYVTDEGILRDGLRNHDA